MMQLEPLPDHPTWALPDSTDTAALLEVISELLIDQGLGSGLTEASVKWRRLFEKAALGLMKRNRDFKFVKLDPTNQLIELRVDLATTQSLAPTRLVCALVSADGPIVPLLFFIKQFGGSPDSDRAIQNEIFELAISMKGKAVAQYSKGK
jgi:hypothetical protein